MRNRPLAALLAALLVLALALAACGGGDDDDSLPAPATSSAAVDTTEPAAFPVTVEGDNGPVTLEEEPDEIVSLSATATESLFAIGAGDQVIAVDEQSNYPADAPVTLTPSSRTSLRSIHPLARSDSDSCPGSESRGWNHKAVPTNDSMLP